MISEIELQKFKEWLLTNKGSKDTVETYFKVVRKFLSEYEFTQDNVNTYASKLASGNKNTANQFVSSIKAYAQFLKTEIYIKYKTPNEPIHDYITETEFINNFLPKICAIFDIHFKLSAMFKFLFYTGLRMGEIVNLKRADINFEEKIVTVRNTKGKKDRNVPFPEKIITEIKAYFNMNKEVQSAFNVTEHQINEHMRKINDLKIFDRRIHIHLFRHSCAKHLLMQGVDVAVVQKILGHKNIKTTLRYVNPDEKMVREMYHKFIK